MTLDDYEKGERPKPKEKETYKQEEKPTQKNCSCLPRYEQVPKHDLKITFYKGEIVVDIKVKLKSVKLSSEDEAAVRNEVARWGRFMLLGVGIALGDDIVQNEEQEGTNWLKS